MRIVVDGRPVEIPAGESLLVSLLRAGLHPTGGGCLCLGGDCPHCLVTLDGVSYVNALAAAESRGIVVEERVPHRFPSNRHNDFYLATKATRFGHLF